MIMPMPMPMPMLCLGVRCRCLCLFLCLCLCRVTLNRGVPSARWATGRVRYADLAASLSRNCCMLHGLAGIGLPHLPHYKVAANGRPSRPFHVPARQTLISLNRVLHFTCALPLVAGLPRLTAPFGQFPLFSLFSFLFSVSVNGFSAAASAFRTYSDQVTKWREVPHGRTIVVHPFVRTLAACDLSCANDQIPACPSALEQALDCRHRRR